MRRAGRRASATVAKTSWAVLLLMLLASRAEAQQQLSHKVLGTLGLEAGSRPSTGVDVVDQFLVYNARDLLDRHGNSLPVGLNVTAFSSVLGATATFALAPLAMHVTVAIDVPMAWASVNTQNPLASIDTFGLGDLYVQPIKLGWRFGRTDVTVGYAFYVPTGGAEPGGNDGVGSGAWTQEPTLGATLFFDDKRRWNVSALASLDINGPKRHVDITRGTTLQIQGGLGTKLWDTVDVGVAAYALWQLTDDTGSALPALLRGARDRVYGAGPEVDVRVPSIRMSVTVRYAHDFLAVSRPQGQIVFAGLTGILWEPRGD